MHCLRESGFSTSPSACECQPFTTSPFYPCSRALALDSRPSLAYYYIYIFCERRTIGLFIPAFTFPTLGKDHLPMLLHFDLVRALLDGLTSSVVGIVGVTALTYLRSSVRVRRILPY